ncbi:uncharacterized protein LOC142465738 isoform X2 [Ascaphus truei]|uniref:uncharacterized protein LOC142465738 isoform X2 n=1 Tax=Ascaphus truei TaxID=8439 RepID=UPI003F5A315F
MVSGGPSRWLLGALWPPSPAASMVDPRKSSEAYCISGAGDFPENLSRLRDGKCSLPPATLPLHRLSLPLHNLVELERCEWQGVYMALPVCAIKEEEQEAPITAWDPPKETANITGVRQETEGITAFKQETAKTASTIFTQETGKIITFKQEAVKTDSIQGVIQETASIQGVIQETASIQGVMQETASIRGVIQETSSVRGVIQETSSVRGVIQETAKIITFKQEAAKTDSIQGVIQETASVRGVIQETPKIITFKQEAAKTDNIQGVIQETACVPRVIQETASVAAFKQEAVKTARVRPLVPETTGFTRHKTTELACRRAPQLSPTEPAEIDVFLDAEDLQDTCDILQSKPRRKKRLFSLKTPTGEKGKTREEPAGEKQTAPIEIRSFADGSLLRGYTLRLYSQRGQSSAPWSSKSCTLSPPSMESGEDTEEPKDEEKTNRTASSTLRNQCLRVITLWHSGHPYPLIAHNLNLNPLTVRHILHVWCRERRLACPGAAGVKKQKAGVGQRRGAVRVPTLWKSRFLVAEGAGQTLQCMVCDRQLRSAKVGNITRHIQNCHSYSAHLPRGVRRALRQGWERCREERLRKQEEHPQANYATKSGGKVQNSKGRQKWAPNAQGQQRVNITKGWHRQAQDTDTQGQQRLAQDGQGQQKRKNSTKGQQRLAQDAKGQQGDTQGQQRLAHDAMGQQGDTQGQQRLAQDAKGQQEGDTEGQQRLAEDAKGQQWDTQGQQRLAQDAKGQQWDTQGQQRLAQKAMGQQEGDTQEKQGLAQDGKKKRQRRYFQDYWRHKFLVDYDWHTDGAVCLVCGQHLSTLRSSTFQRHAQRRHPESLCYPGETRKALWAAWNIGEATFPYLNVNTNRARCQSAQTSLPCWHRGKKVQACRWQPSLGGYQGEGVPVCT